MKILKVFMFFPIMCYSCNNRESSVYGSELRSWKEEGWSFKEELGKPGKYIFVSNFKSDSASTINAIWVQEGKREEKEFFQKDESILILNFMKNDSDSFVVVMSKEKQ